MNGLQRAGFTMDTQVLEWASVLDHRAKPGDLDVFTTSRGFPPDPAMQTFLSATCPDFANPVLRARSAQGFHPPSWIAAWNVSPGRRRRGAGLTRGAPPGCRRRGGDDPAFRGQPRL